MRFGMLALLSKWPLMRQICERKDGTGLESMSDKTRAMHARIDDAKVARSICPYCGVGCGQLIYHKDGKLVSIEGAMDMVAERVWESRKRTFVRQVDGSTVNHTTAICHLGGATLDNEENYLIKKL